MPARGTVSMLTVLTVFFTDACQVLMVVVVVVVVDRFRCQVSAPGHQN